MPKGQVWVYLTSKKQQPQFQFFLFTKWKIKLKTLHKLLFSFFFFCFHLAMKTEKKLKKDALSYFLWCVYKHKLWIKINVETFSFTILYCFFCCDTQTTVLYSWRYNKRVTEVMIQMVPSHSARTLAESFILPLWVSCGLFCIGL